jgi:hypothetical protein
MGNFLAAVNGRIVAFAAGQGKGRYHKKKAPQAGLVIFWF